MGSSKKELNYQILPLTPGQKALWLLYNMDSEGYAYNLNYIWYVRSGFDEAKFVSVLKKLVARYPAWRSTYGIEGDEPAQRLFQQRPLFLDEVDGSSWSDEELETNLKNEIFRSLDLENEGPVRWRIIKRAGQDTILSLLVHHMASDVWSVMRMANDLRALYAAEVNGGTAELEPISLTNAQFVQEQETLLNGPEGEKLWDFWQETLTGGEVPVLNLQTDKPRPPAISFHGGAYHWPLPKKLTNAMMKQAKKLGTSPFQFCLSAYQLFLSRYTGQKDILVGVPTGGRSEAYTNVFNYYVSPVICRAHLPDENIPFSDFVASNGAKAMEAVKAQGYPFPLIAQKLLKTRDTSRNPLYQAQFLWENENRFCNRSDHMVSLGKNCYETWDMGEMSWERVPVKLQTDQFDLSLKMAKVGNSYYCALDYSSDLFLPETAEKMAANFQALLDRLSADPSLPIFHADALHKKERETLLVKRNKTKVKYPQDRGFHELFAQFVKKTPDAPAIVFEEEVDGELTYAELDAKANKVANYLRKKGVDQEVFVGLCMHRSVDMVVGLLGILKAGGAYVPLDPGFPQDRLAYMLEDSGLNILITEEDLKDYLGDHDADVLILDTQWSTVEKESDTDPQIPIDPNSRAYVIYTSGSTGKPKGVQISHQAFTNFIVTMVAERPGLGADDVLLAVTTLSFDICGLELWGPLISGGKIVLASKAVASDGTRLLNLLKKSKATAMQATPISWRLMLGAGWQPDKPLKMMCGGEPLPPELAKQMMARGDLWNMYGPTETTVWSTVHNIKPEEPSISIGTPIANTDIYIIDRFNNPVPDGCAGELLIGGDGLARGYHNRPDLTAQQFVPNPFSTVPGDRMYKTGDMARYLPSSLLECLGRIDHQVKIRGFRIELGEIESVLARQDEVKEAVVLAREDSPGNKMLVAYTVSQSGERFDVSKIKDAMRVDLPEYMVPPIFVQMDEFPLTPNGKINKKGLPAPDVSGEDLAGEYVAPRSAQEEIIAAIWSKVLGVERVGLTDNFFELGGHSLKASQVISRVREAFGVEVPQTRFFQDPSVGGLSKLVDMLQERDDVVQLPPIRPLDHGDSALLSLNQQRLWFIDQMMPNTAAYNIPYAFNMTGKLDLDIFEQALDSMVVRHDILRTRFDMRDGQPAQIISSQAPVNLELIDLRTLPEKDRPEESIRQAINEGLRPFHLTRGPLFRFALEIINDEEHIFLLTMHHIISDGWSIGVFMKELLSFYDALLDGVEPELDPLPITYADYSHWQRNWLTGEALDKETEFWKGALGGAQLTLELPADRPRPKVQTFDGALQPIHIDEALMGKLSDLCKGNNATLFMALHAAFNVFLYRYTTHEDILVGTPMANRNRSEVEGLIGFFVNTLVLRTDLSNSPSFQELIGRVRETCLATFSHQDFPFEKLVEELQPERDLSRNPVFQVMFVLHNNPMPELCSKDFQLEILDLERGMAHFDLTLTLAYKENGLRGGFEYNTNLFDRQTAERMAGNFLTLLLGLANSPEQPITEINLLTQEEMKLSIDTWNDNQLPQPELCPFQMFELAAANHPDKTAIYFGEEAISYAEVNQRANRLAHHLRSLGIGPDKLVGISQERSPNMTISMLGIQKAGGAYVPLDPKHPEERIQYIMDEARVSVLVTQAHLSEKLSGQSGDLVIIDEPDAALSGASGENPETVSGINNLSHVIYTSGSTGKPKGVAINHGPVTQLVAWTEHLFTEQERDCMLASTSMNFDLSVYENVATLALGGTIVLVENALYLPMDVNKDRVTTINTVPSAIKELIRQKGIPETVTTVNLAGEQLKESVVQDLYAIDHIERVYNLYGPSEDTTYSTWALMERDPDYTVKIGVPLNNTQAYILDANLKPLPIGVPGELMLAGIGLARGYLNRDDLTKERFLPNPFLEAKGAVEHGPIIYRTGDLVRWRPNGQLECLGRIDHQVKIRGFRIELGEIEAVMQRYEKVHEVVVMDRENAYGEKYLAGYVTLKLGFEVDDQEIRSYVGEHLPEYMVPTFVMILDTMPLNPNGKIDRKKLPDPSVNAPTETVEKVLPQGAVEQIIADVWKEVLGLSSVDTSVKFFEIGGNSLNATRVRFRLQEELDRELQITDIFQYPTISGLAAYLDPDGATASLKTRKRNTDGGNTDVAVIGVAGKFPGADTPEQLWDNLCNGVEAITEYTREECEAAGVDSELLDDPQYVRKGFIIDNVDQFDAGFFGFSPREAQVTDPQQRLFLEKAWEALEVAGYNPDSYTGRIGVYGGLFGNTYLRNNLLPNKKLVKAVGHYGMMIGGENDFMATRVSFKLNLTGPAMTVQTACSTSLVAIHMACKSLIDGESDIMMAGGVGLLVPQKTGYMYMEGGTMSPDGHVRPFDHNAAGMMPGNGVVIVVLKRLQEAVDDGDHILATVKGSAINNDGSDKVGFTAPSVEGQATAIADAQEMAGFNPETITYIEAHGTGTNLGDPIEIAALTKAFRVHTEKTGFCRIGSIKANIGHLDAGAGAAGFVKAVLSLHHRKIPPTLNFESPNPAIGFEKTPFVVNTQLHDWEPEGIPRRAAVSSFGIGGTNAHAVLEEAPSREPSSGSRPCQVLMLSGRTPTALERCTENLLSHLKRSPDANLADTAYTLQIGRKTFPHRRAILASDFDEAIQNLELQSKKTCFTNSQEAKAKPIVFMFSGQGSQYVNMGLDLYRNEPVFRNEVDECSEVLNKHLKLDLRDVLYPTLSDGRELTADELKEASARINQTSMAQPTLFVIEYATAKLWMSWGLKPESMIGHSIGEYVAATLAGVMSRDDALGLVAARGRLMQSMPTGSMLALPFPEEEAKPYLSDLIQMATINAPNRCVVAGPDEAITELKARLKEDGKSSSILHTSHAFHSAMMDSCLPSFTSEVKKVRLSAPTVKYVSNITGTWITDEQATDPQYYPSHLRGAVRFSDGLKTLYEGDNKIFLEVGPGKTLMTFARQQASKESEHQALNSIRHPKDKDADTSFIMGSIAQLWISGVDIDWNAFYAEETRYRVPLPTYPFERKRFWIDPPAQEAQAIQPAKQSPQPIEITERPKETGPLVRYNDVKDWYYAPLWKQSTLPMPLEEGALSDKSKSWMIFCDATGFGAAMASRLELEGADVYRVTPGHAFYRISDRVFSLNPTAKEHYAALVSATETFRKPLGYVVHGWGITEQRNSDDIQFSRTCIDTGCMSLVLLLQALDHGGFLEPLKMGVLSNNTYRLSGESWTAPEKATLAGPIRVTPREYPHIMTRGIDLVLPQSGTPSEHRMVGRIINDLLSPSVELISAYRGRLRWIPTFEKIEIAPPQKSLRLRAGGVYLITGGLGGIGLVIAQYLAKTVKAKMVLLRRSPFPQRHEWDAYQSSCDENDAKSRTIQVLRGMESLGSEVMVASVDVTDAEQMQGVVSDAQSRFGTIHGVVHAAGAYPTGMITEMSVEGMNRVLDPKVAGTLVIEKVLSSSALDFMVLFSSTSAVLGNAGFLDYCSANSFLDAYSMDRSSDDGPNVVAMSWDGWKDVGMAMAQDVPESQREKHEKILAELISPQEGTQAFHEILNGCDHPQVLVSPKPFDRFLGDIKRYLKLNQASQDNTPVRSQPKPVVHAKKVEIEIVAPPKKVSPPKPTMPAQKVAEPPAQDNQILKTLKTFWEESLGHDDLGLDDDFVEMGGDSLLATMLVGRMRKAFRVKMPPTIINDHPTLGQMAAHIASLIGAPAPTTNPSPPPAPQTPPEVKVPEPQPSGPNPIEEISSSIAELWQEALGHDSVDYDDNFIDLGGDSLLATMLVGRMRRLFKVKLSPDVLNEHPTIREISAHISGLLGHDIQQPQVEQPKAEPVQKDPKPDTSEPPAQNEPSLKARPQNLGTPYRAASSDLEKELIEIWQAEFDINGLGVDDPFLALGGSSQLAQAISGKIDAIYTLEITPDDIIDESTVSAVAEKIETLLWARSGSDEGDDEDSEEFEL